MQQGYAEINGRNRSPPSTEDRHFIESLPGGITIAGVFDGHGGLSTVVYTINNLPNLLKALIHQTEGDINQIKSQLKDVFIQHDKNLAARGYISYRDTGSTATIAIITPSDCIIAHIGDSPACVVDPTNGDILYKIEPHLPNHPVEKTRIIRCQGTVTQDPGDAPRVNGSLMVSRAFGDFSMKFKNAEIPEMNKNWTTDFCVSAEPDILSFSRNPGSKGILAIFSDGLLDTESGELKEIEEIGKMVYNALKLPGNDYSHVARNVINNHVSSLSSPYTGDDTTLLLINIGVPIIGGAMTKKARRVKRLKKQTKRATEGLKTFLI